MTDGEDVCRHEGVESTKCSMGPKEGIEPVIVV